MESLINEFTNKSNVFTAYLKPKRLETSDMVEKRWRTTKLEYCINTWPWAYGGVTFFTGPGKYVSLAVLWQANCWKDGMDLVWSNKVFAANGQITFIYMKIDRIELFCLRPHIHLFLVLLLFCFHTLSLACFHTSIALSFCSIPSYLHCTFSFPDATFKPNATINNKVSNNTMKNQQQSNNTNYTWLVSNKVNRCKLTRFKSNMDFAGLLIYHGFIMKSVFAGVQQ